jgi:hypothetical protein
LFCYGYGTLVWVYLGVLVPAVYTPYIMGSMALLLLVAVTRIRPTYRTLSSRSKPMCPICGVNSLGVFRNQCKACGRNVCYKCLHPKIKWLCCECGRCTICGEGPALAQCKTCGRRVCHRCTATHKVCMICVSPDLSVTEEAKVVLLTPSLQLPDKALHCLEERIKAELAARNAPLWKGLTVTCLGAQFRVLGTKPPTKVRLGPMTRVVAGNPYA